MDTLILYGSQYGTTQRYAERFSELVNIPAAAYDKAEDLTKYRQIVYFGALYAGGVKGLKRIVKRVPEDIKMILVTVGLADVHDENNVRNIRRSIEKQVPQKLLESAEIFHLRGGIDYQKLNFSHRTMMTLLYHKVKGLPEDKKTAEDRAMIETFNTKVDFVDYDSLAPVIAAVGQRED